MLKKINHHDKEPTYRSFETSIEYDCFKGAFSWPVEGRHGYICVIGLETESKKLRLTAEYQENGMTEFARRLKVLREFYPISYWIAPTEGEWESYYNTLQKISRQEGTSLSCSQPTLADDLQLAAHLIERELHMNSFIVPQKGIMIREIPRLKSIDMDDHSRMAKMQPIITVARLIFEFPNVEKRIEPKRSKDAYAEGFEDKEGGSWLSVY